MNNFDDDSSGADNDALVASFLKQWPIFDTLEFAGASLDVTKWDDETYTLLISFHCDTEGVDPPYSGYSIYTQVSGQSVEDLQSRVELLISSGMLDGLKILTTGTVWDVDGKEVGKVDWSECVVEEGEQTASGDHFSEIEFDENLLRKTKLKPPTTLQ